MNTSYQPKRVNGSIQTASTCTTIKIVPSNVKKLCNSLLISRGQRLGDCNCVESANPTATANVSNIYAVKPPARATFHVISSHLAIIAPPLLRRPHFHRL